MQNLIKLLTKPQPFVYFMFIFFLFFIFAIVFYHKENKKNKLIIIIHKQLDKIW